MERKFQPKVYEVSESKHAMKSETAQERKKRKLLKKSLGERLAAEQDRFVLF